MDSSESAVRASDVDQATFNAHGIEQFVSTGNSSQHIYQNTSSGTMTNIGRIVGGAVFNSVNTLPGQVPFTGSYAFSSLQPVASYVSRQKLEQQLENELQSPSEMNSSHKMRTVVVWGFGGVGKSQLVLNYVREHQQQYQAVFWIQAGQRETIERDYIRIYKQLYPGSNNVLKAATMSVEDAIVSVKSWLQRQDRRCLWVMDSADDVEDDKSSDYIDLHHYLPFGPQLDRIVTTRSSTAQEFSSQDAIEVNEMAEGEAIALFQQCAGTFVKYQHNEDDVRKIVNELGCLALAVTLAGSYVHEDPDMATDLNSYLAALRQHQVEILKQKPHRLIHQYGESLLSTWEISYNMVQRQSPVAARLLNVLAFLHFDDIFLDLLIERSKAPDRHQADSNEYDDRPGKIRLRDRLREPFRRLQRSSNAHDGDDLPRGASWVQLISIDASENTVTPDTIKTALRILQRYSLISWQRNQHAYGIHKLVHSWSHDRLPTEERQTWSLAVLELLASTIDDHEGDLSTEQRLVPHVMANFAAMSAACGPMYQTTNKERHSISTAADLLRRIGRWIDQLNVQRYLFQVALLALGVEHPDTLTSMNNLAVVLGKQGEYEQAAEMYRQTLKLNRKILGPEHSSTLTSMNNLAVVLGKQGEYEQAAQLNRQTLNLRQKILGPKNPDTLASMNNLAVVLGKQGEYEQAAEIHRETLKLLQKVLGVEHPDTFMGMHNLAGVLSKQGEEEQEQAITMFRENIKLMQKVLGPEHPKTLRSMHSLAGVLSKQGEAEQQEAIAIYREGIELRQRMLGPEHPKTLRSMSNLAYVLGQQGEDKQEEAIATYRETLKLRQKALGPEHPNALTCMDNLAILLERRGEHEEAQRLKQSILEFSKK